MLAEYGIVTGGGSASGYLGSGRGGASFSSWMNFLESNPALVLLGLVGVYFLFRMLIIR